MPVEKKLTNWQVVFKFKILVIVNKARYKSMTEGTMLDLILDGITKIPLIIKQSESLSLISCLFVVLIICIHLFKNSTQILDLYERKEKKTFERLDAYVLSKEGIDDNVLKTAKDVRNGHYFKIATGIYAESSFRDELIKLHELNPNVLNWKVIKSAIDYLEVNKSGEISVNPISKWGKIFRWWNFFEGGVLMILSIIWLLATFFAYFKSRELSLFITGLATCLFLYTFSLLAFLKNLGGHNSMRIAKELKAHLGNNKLE